LKPRPDTSSSVVTWTAMMQAYNLHEKLNEAWNLFREMENIGIVFDEHVFSIVLSVLGKMKNLQEGQRIHQLVKVTNNFYKIIGN
jgi:pentatricopeptide repeat protein